MTHIKHEHSHVVKVQNNARQHLMAHTGRAQHEKWGCSGGSKKWGTVSNVTGVGSSRKLSNAALRYISCCHYLVTTGKLKSGQCLHCKQTSESSDLVCPLNILEGHECGFCPTCSSSSFTQGQQTPSPSFLSRTQLQERLETRVCTFSCVPADGHQTPILPILAPTHGPAETALAWVG